MEMRWGKKNENQRIDYQISSLKCFSSSYNLMEGIRKIYPLPSIFPFFFFFWMGALTGDQGRSLDINDHHLRHSDDARTRAADWGKNEKCLRIARFQSALPVSAKPSFLFSLMWRQFHEAL